MSSNTNLLCFEVTTHLRAGEIQQIISCLKEDENAGIVSCVQDSPNSCYVSRILVFKKGTEDLEKMKLKESLFIERFIVQHYLNLKAEIINIEVKFKEERTIPTDSLDKYNPVCLQHYFMEELDENK